MESVCLERHKKCGYVYRSPTINDKQNIILSCLYCNSISFNLEEFLLHLDCIHSIEDNLDSLFKEDVNEDADVKPTEICIEGNSLLVEYDPLSEHCEHNELLPCAINSELIDETTYNNQNLNANRDSSNNFKGLEIIKVNNKSESSNENFEPKKYTADSENDDNDEYLNEQYDEEDDSDDAEDIKEDITRSKTLSEEKTNLKRFTKNHEFIKAVINAYQKQTLLWDSAYEAIKISSPEKQKSINNIQKEINYKFEINATAKQVERIINRLRSRYLRHIELRESGQSYKSLWFLDLMTFLDPHFKKNKSKTGFCKRLEDEQFIELIKLFKVNECFWNENNIYHTSTITKQEMLKAMTNNFTNICKLKDFNSDIMQNIIDEIIEMAKAENINKLNHLAIKRDEEYQSSNKFYKDIQFLLPHVGPFKCKHCQKTFTDIYAYKFHISRHDGTKPFKCMACPRELTHKKEFICHLRRHTKECPFQCDSCDKSFPSKKEWHRHVIKHGSKPYVCELCADSFYTQHQLTNHMKNHNNIRDHVCPECGKGFTHRGLLRQHLQTHNKTKCVCPLCENIYSNPRSMRKHYVRVHEIGNESSNAALAQYNCKICKIKFATIQDANQHRKEHKQSNPIKRKHVCDICGHHFAYPRNLADHKKIHSNIRDQVCDVCGKAFTNTNLLNQHKNVHIGEKYVCKACGKDYAHYRGLCRHITKVHNTNIRDLDAVIEKQISETASSPS